MIRNHVLRSGAAHAGATPAGRSHVDGIAGRVRSERFGQKLGEWSDDDLADFAGRLARYNASLD